MNGDSEHAKVAREIDSLYDLYRSGMIDEQGFGAKYQPHSERARRLDDEIPTTQARLDALKITRLSQEEIISGARDLYTRLPPLPFEERLLLHPPST